MSRRGRRAQPPVRGSRRSHGNGTVDVLPAGDGSLVVYSTEVAPDDGKQLFDAAIASAVKGLKTSMER